MTVRFSQLAPICQGEVIQLVTDHAISHLMTDSRKPLVDGQSVFFAIRGSHHDGHHYIQGLYDQGITSFVLEQTEGLSLTGMPQANIIQVSSSLQALQKLATYKRSQYHHPLVAIAGSNGKTIIKEWLAHFIADRHLVLKSPGSYNSQLGVPLSIWPMQERHEWAVIEAGISQPGEMQQLEALIKPTEGIFTNLGSAHDEGFTSRKQKAVEKASLFRHCQQVYYCREYRLVHEALQSQLSAGQRLISWSTTGANATYQVKTQQGSGHTVLTISGQGQINSFDVPYREAGMLENITHCLIYLLDHDFEPIRLQELIASLPPVKMRLELKEGINGCYLVDDTYNNDLAGLQLALDFLEQQRQRKQKTLIISDLLEADPDQEALYTQLADLVSKKGLHRLIGIGPSLNAQATKFTGIEAEFYPDTAAFIADISKLGFRDELILIKGARDYRFEEIVNRLQQKMHGTHLEINLAALTHNLNFFRARLRPETKVMVMVKAFAYGGGSAEIARLLQYHRVDYLGVAYVDEGIALRQQGIRLPIMVLNPSEDSWATCTDYQLEPEIYSWELLKSLLHYVQNKQLVMPIHLKLDTGMHRLGFTVQDAAKLAGVVAEQSLLKVKSIFSHLAAADEQGQDDFSHQQARAFEEQARVIKQHLAEKPWCHLLNSAGIIRFSEYQFDMVRLGVALYGVDPTRTLSGKLQNVSSLKTTISQVHALEPGETVGYGRQGKVDEPMQVATIAIGYADGFSRLYGNGRASVWVNGHRAPVIGNVCMDMTMIDVTGVGCRAGDEVELFGEHITVGELANWAGTIPYEVLTNIRERVKRVFVAG